MAKRTLQPLTSSAQESQGALDAGTQAREFRSGWIGTTEAVAHLGLKGKYPLDALYHLIAEHELPFGRLGNRYRFRRDQLDQWVEVRGVAALAAVRKAS